jgi:hypothetical protein
MLAGLLATSLVTDAHACPQSSRRWPVRSFAGAVVHLLIVTSCYGLFLAVCGHPIIAALLALALMITLVFISNAKNAMLGEPLLFSDFALIGAVLRHPQFYLSAVRPWQIGAMVLVVMALPVLLWWLFVPNPQPHLAGLALLTGALASLTLTLHRSPWAGLAFLPDAKGDLSRHGLLATLLLHARRWRQSGDPPLCPAALPATSGTELVIIVQCESFADPGELFADPALALPGLASARSQAWRWGGLQVSGFGAYTMRTEYGVLFGRCENELGFRRFDPFLTALGEASYALPARLRPAGWRSLFLHPHDMRFYNRDRIMPAAGFDELLGLDSFDVPRPGEGRYVTDAAMTERIVALARASTSPKLLYAVTIENHGPWAPDTVADGARLSQSYLRLVRNSDAMLAALCNELGRLGRPAMLVFFGDHRPSIPGLSMPGGDRRTPYVILRFDAAGQPLRGNGQPLDISPADLHHLILAALAG